MAFTREDVATYEQQPQTQVELPTSVVEVAADTPVVEPVSTEATPAADGADADATAEGGSSADDVEGEPATPSGEPSAATDPPKGSARARIMELVDERNAYKKFGSVAEQRIADLEAQLAATRGTKPAAAAETTAVAADTATDDDPAPSPEDADVQYDPVKLSQKTARWLKAQVDKGVKAGVAQALNTDKSATAAVAARQAFDARVDAFEKTPEGKEFRARLSADGLPKLPPPVGHKIGTDEMGPAILNVIAADVASAKEFAALPVEDQLVRIGEIKADLKAKAKAAPAAAAAAAATPAAKPVKQPKTVSTAPPPPTRVPAGANSQKRSLTDPTLSMDDFVRLDREEANAARAAKRAQRGLR